MKSYPNPSHELVAAELHNNESKRRSQLIIRLAKLRWLHTDVDKDFREQDWLKEQLTKDWWGNDAYRVEISNKYIKTELKGTSHVMNIPPMEEYIIYKEDVLEGK